MPGSRATAGGVNSGDSPARGGYGGGGNERGGNGAEYSPNVYGPNSKGRGSAGGGGWGAKGGNSNYGTGGAAGKAFTGTSVSLSNSGTIYGAT